MTVYTCPGTIDATGATDVTSAMAAWLATVPDGVPGSRNTITFPNSSTYRTEGSVTLTDRNHLDIDGNASWFVMDTLGTISRHSWALFNCSEISISDMHIRGANPTAGLADSAYDGDLEMQHGFAIWSSRTIVITTCAVEKVWGDWVYLGMSGGNGWCDGVTIEDNDFISNGRQGFGFVACRNVIVRYNTTTECRRSLIDFEPNGPSWGCDNIHIHTNTFGPQRLSFIASKGMSGAVDNILVEDNSIAYTMTSEINPQGFGLRNNWTVRNNIAVREYGASNQAAMRFWRTDGLTVTGNIQPLQAGRNMHMVRVADCTDYTVTGNTITPGGVGQVLVVDTPDPGEDPTSGDTFTAPTVIGTQTLATTSINPTLNVPAGTSTGDFLFALVGHYGSDFLPLLPAGWSVVGSVSLLPTNAFPGYFHVLRRTVAPGDASFSFPQVEGSVSYRTCVILLTVRGATSISPEHTLSNADQTTDNALITVPALTTITSGCLVLYFAFQRSGNGVISDPLGEVNVAATVKNSASSGVALFAGWRVWSGNGTGKSRVFSSTFLNADGSVVAAYPGISAAPSTAEGVYVFDELVGWREVT